MGFTSRKQKILKYYILLKEGEHKNNKDLINKCIFVLKQMNLSKSEIKEMELNRYF